MKKLGLAILLFLVFLLVPAKVLAAARFWDVQSVDTVKYSRDVSRGQFTDAQIEDQIKKIAALGATHVALGTPYDPEFLPWLRRWITMARRYHLNVWFRGNWSGWEGWFSYPQNVTREQHLALTKNFILDNPDLFADGDVFTACPECENGGPRDPRKTGDVAGFRQFIIDEYQMTKDAFATIHKQVISNFNSMNGDVARLVMDSSTTRRMDGVVTIDHYVATPDKLAADIAGISSASGGKIVLGEFGTPIPDITGPQDEAAQASWLKSALGKLVTEPQLAGLNYWVGFGGTTALWNPDGSPRSAASVIAGYFRPAQLQIHLVDTSGSGISGAQVIFLSRTAATDTNGNLTIPKADNDFALTISADGYLQKEMTIRANSANSIKIVLERKSEGILMSMTNLLRSILATLSGVYHLHW